MLYPTIDELTQGNKFNRYELALATAKCARLITEEYVRQHDLSEKTGSKEDRASVDRELRDEKAVKVAINRIYRGVFEIDENAGDMFAELEEEPVREERSLAEIFAEEDDEGEAEEEDLGEEAEESSDEE